MPVTITIPDESTFVARGISFTHSWADMLANYPEEAGAMLVKAATHGLKQYCGDAGAGSVGEAIRADVTAAYGRRHDWMRDESRSRASLPAAESMFLTEARLWLRARKVASKITAAIGSRDTALAEIETLIAAACKTKGRDAAEVPALVATVVGTIEATVATRIAAATSVDPDLGI